ncbi:neural proliferation differentiation and control protein 1 isoform X2 [Takifugu flavidus]|uniref:neural proliferation differentiation and control protein 1 isoform X2 n=1 Tax=Takifugu flavidus TaxID=433684 RepID=UPI002544793C|nr:neural proliferation differentiation and control protein 1 isoform X2 [Takifugu flavidus]
MRAPLGRAAVLAALLTLSTCLTGKECVPRSLDCARAGRHFCQPGSSQCGPCLYPLVETSRGRCVVRRRPTPRPAHPSHGTVSRFPELDEEIDLLSAVISEQRTISKVPAVPQDPSRPESSPAAPTERPRSHSVPVPSVNPAGTTNNTTPDLLSAPVILPYPPNNNVFIIMSSVLIIAGSVALVVAAACWVRLQRGVHLTQKMDYPVYGLMGAPTFDSLPGDKRLAHSAQMFHYQHQKQQMLSMEKHRDEPKVPDSGASTDEENEDGDFTVYECPGLAPTGEMEVKNPLFDDSTLYFQRFHK